MDEHSASDTCQPAHSHNSSSRTHTHHHLLQLQLSRPCLRTVNDVTSFVPYCDPWLLVQGLPLRPEIMPQLLSLRDQQGCNPLHLAILQGKCWCLR